MRDAVINRQFQHFRVDHDQAAFIRRQLVQQRQDHGVDRHRFTRSGRTRDQQVRHLGKVGHHRVTADILAQCKRQRMFAIAIVAPRKDFAETHHFAVVVRQLDPDHAPARQGGHTGRQRRHGPRNIISKANHAAGLEARRRFKLVHGHNGARTHADDFALDTVIIQYGFQHAGVFFERFVRQHMTLNFIRAHQQVQRREFVVSGAIIKGQLRLRLGLCLTRLNNRLFDRMLHDLTCLGHRHRCARFDNGQRVMLHLCLRGIRKDIYIFVIFDQRGVLHGRLHHQRTRTAAAQQCRLDPDTCLGTCDGRWRGRHFTGFRPASDHIGNTGTDTVIIRRHRIGKQPRLVFNQLGFRHGFRCTAQCLGHKAEKTAAFLYRLCTARRGKCRSLGRFRRFGEYRIGTDNIGHAGLFIRIGNRSHGTLLFRDPITLGTVFSAACLNARMNTLCRLHRGRRAFAKNAQDHRIDHNQADQQELPDHPQFAANKAQNKGAADKRQCHHHQ